MTNINWQKVLTHAKNYMLNDLPKNVDRKIVEEHGTPFLNELNGIVGYLIEDSKKGYTLSPATKRYISARIIPSVKQSIDSYWDSLSFIKQQTFRGTQSLFPNKIDLLLFDVTTLYFESIDIDEVRNFGYSKDFRFNTTQAVLALATNQDGLPIGYELFEGNKAEVGTLLLSIQSWRKLFDIESVCFVADRAMFTKENLALLEQHNCQYIVAAKLKKLPKVVKSESAASGLFLL